MENCLTDVRDEFTFPCLDDVLVYSDHFDSHVDHSRKVFQILRENDFKVKAKKCKLFQKQINCLGCTVTEKEYGKIHLVTDLVTNVPSNIVQLRRVPGLYRVL